MARLRNPRLWAAVGAPGAPAIVLFAVTYLVVGLLNPRFVQPSGIGSFFESYLPLVLAALGMSVVMIGGGIDLSMGATVSLVNVVFITLVERAANPWFAALVALASGAAVGVLNGVVVAWGRIPPLLGTLGTMFVVNGICLMIMPVPMGSAPSSLVTVYASGLLSVPYTVLAVALLIALWHVASRTTFATRLYAVGGDSRSAFATGLPVQSMVAWSYLVCSVLTGIAGLALTADVATAGPTIGNNITMQAVAAAVIGGVSLMGGYGSPVGAVFGALFLGLISKLVVSAGVSSYWVSFTTGAVVLCGIVFTSLLRQRRRMSVGRTAPAPVPVVEP